MRIIALVLVLALAFPGIGHAQEAQPAGSFIDRFLRDERALWTSPFQIQRGNLKWVVPLGIGTGALLGVDRRISKEAGELPGIQHPSHIVSQAGSYPVVIAPVALMALGHLAGNERAVHAGSVGLQAVLHSMIIVQLLKASTNRERPSKLQGDGGFWDGGKSFPSGHAMSTWALASAMSDQYSDRKWVRIAGYGVATAVSLSRIGGQNHFPSDVLFGASVGWLIGHYVSQHHKR